MLVDGKLTYSRSPYSPEIGHVKMEDCTKLLAKTEGKEGSKKYIFVIQTTFGRDYTLQAASETEQTRWMETINSYHGMATNSTRPLLDSLSSSLEAQKSERALRRMTVMYPNLNMEEEPPAPRKRPVTMVMADPQLSFSSMHTDIAALTSGLASTDNTHLSPRSGGGAGGPVQAAAQLPTKDLSSPREVGSTNSGAGGLPSSSSASSSSSVGSASAAAHGTGSASPRRQNPYAATPTANSKSGDDSSDESESKGIEGDEEDVVGSDKNQDGKGGMGRQMSKLLKRKKDNKKTDLLTDLSQRVTALEAQLELSEQQNEERKQAQEILNEELLEQRRRYDEEKRKWAAQIDQLKEKYFLSLVVSAKLNYMLSSNDGDSINVRAPALWEQAAADEVEVEDFTNYIAQHIDEAVAAANGDRRRQPGGGSSDGKVGYDHYYSYVRDDSDPRRRV